MTDTLIEVRNAVPADRDSIQAMAQEVVDAGDVFVFEKVSDVMDYWYQPGGHVAVAARGSEVLGTYVISPNQKGRGSHVANTGYMVRRAARGLGIGSTLGKHSLESARALGYKAMQFNMVVATNEDAAHLWRKLGFDVVGRLPGAFPARGARSRRWPRHVSDAVTVSIRNGILVRGDAECIRIIYRWVVEQENQAAFVAAWEKATTSIRETTPGARGSFCLVGVENPTEVLTIAKWDDLDQWRAFVKTAQSGPMREMHALGQASRSRGLRSKR